MTAPGQGKDGPISPGDFQSATIAPTSFEPLGADQQPRRGPRNPRRWALAAVATGFALVMLFLFLARPVEIRVQADTPAEVNISGLYLPFGDRILILPGEYALAARAPGYHPREATLAVGDGANQVLEIQLRPLPGLLAVNSEPAGARVLVDGEAIGQTPLADYRLEAGNYRLRLEHPRYRALEQDLAITGREVQQTLQLAMEPAWAEVSISSAPSGAQILVDGEAMGTTPATLELLEGERQLILQKADFADLHSDLTIVAGEPLALDSLALQPAAGRLELSSRPSGANVTLDGEFQGQTPLTLELTPARSHQVAVFKPGYRRHSDSLQLAAGEVLAQDITLQPRLGEVEFRISPPQATLRINGRPVGQGPQTLSLPAFEHRVEVVLDGHASVQRRVTPRPGLQQLVAVELQTVEQARMANIPPEITTSVGQTLLLFKPEDSPRNQFTMGASRREPGRRANEVLRPVELRRMFYLQTTEVTNAQFRLFQANHDSGQVESNSLNREHQPAVQVSWQQAAQFCNWLSRREGLPPFYQQTQGIVTGFNPEATGYRLPTEAEWAWAARVRGEELLRFPWGDEFPPDKVVGNYADNTSAYVTGRILNGYTDGHVTTATVASFPPNHNGLYDMGGNVAEWVNDVYSIPPANSPLQVDPLGAQSGDNFVIRGAGWAQSKLAELRLSFRDYGQAGRDDVGFRIARYAE